MFPGSITTPGGAFTPYSSAWAQFAADPTNAQALQGYQQVMAMMQQAGGFMPFAYPGDKEDGPRKSAKLRLGPEMGRTSAMERLGGNCPAQSRHSRESETIHLGEEEAESQPRASAYTRLSYDEDDLDKIGSVARKLRALEEKVDEKAGAKKHTLAKSPFSARVHAQKLRRKVKLDMEKFTGKEDPNVHLDTFHNAAQMAGCTDAEECLLFFSSLRGRPVEWFNGLPHGRIGSFEKLAEVFRKKPGINQVRAIISMAHLCMKFYTPNGIGEERGDQKNARSCYLEAVKKMTRQFEQIELVSQQVDKGEEKARIEPDANTEEIQIDASNPERKVKIGTDLQEELRTEIVQVLTRPLEVGQEEFNLDEVSHSNLEVDWVRRQAGKKPT
ncbi:unnamed protein product [Cuscuta campestris]|uniref:Retrotransposon gag domain-containing protein n=1 Tax=Cuscuta campestris TaxID=132261 RepID=A0A484KZQ6_9ASTE|nr:unnamed protein product [Cuscuta campestris]